MRIADWGSRKPPTPRLSLLQGGTSHALIAMTTDTERRIFDSYCKQNGFKVTTLAPNLPPSGGSAEFDIVFTDRLDVLEFLQGRLSSSAKVYAVGHEESFFEEAERLGATMAITR